MTAPEGLALALVAALLLVWIVRHRQYVCITLFGLLKVELSDKPPTNPKTKGK